MATKLRYGDATEINKMEEAAGIEPTVLPKNEGKTPAASPVGNERTYKNNKGQDVAKKKNWWWPF